MNLFLIISACFLISLCVCLTVLFLYFKKDLLNKITVFLVSLSAGALIGGAFLHLLPEASEELDNSILYSTVLVAFVFFFFMEKMLFWRHCHKGDCAIHSFGYMNLIGDSIHNFTDGLIIAAAFLTDIRVGIATTLAIALHEIPQEIGDFGVLIHAGFSRKKALVINYMIASVVIVGGIFGYFTFFALDKIIPYLLPFAAGGFIYIAASDLMPEIKKETDLKKSITSFLIFLLGISLMFLL